MVKIIYLDIDGTLRDEINEITKNVKDAIRKCRETVPSVQTGRFGAEMEVSLINDGPFTILLDSDTL